MFTKPLEDRVIKDLVDIGFLENDNMESTIDHYKQGGMLMDRENIYNLLN